MSITEKFQALQFGEQAGLLLALAVIIVPTAVWAWRAFVDYCEAQPIYDPMVAGPEDLPSTLRRPLPPARNMVGAAQTQFLHAQSHDPDYFRIEGLQNDPGYMPKGIQNSLAEAFRQDAEVQRQMLADTMKGTKQ